MSFLVRRKCHKSSSPNRLHKQLIPTLYLPGSSCRNGLAYPAMTPSTPRILVFPTPTMCQRGLSLPVRAGSDDALKPAPESYYALRNPQDGQATGCLVSHRDWRNATRGMNTSRMSTRVNRRPGGPVFDIVSSANRIAPGSAVQWGQFSQSAATCAKHVTHAQFHARRSSVPAYRATPCANTHRHCQCN